MRSYPNHWVEALTVHGLDNTRAGTTNELKSKLGDKPDSYVGYGPTRNSVRSVSIVVRTGANRNAWLAANFGADEAEEIALAILIRVKEIRENK